MLNVKTGIGFWVNGLSVLSRGYRIFVVGFCFVGGFFRGRRWRKRGVLRCLCLIEGGVKKKEYRYGVKSSFIWSLDRALVVYCCRVFICVFGGF